jgi:hypothetical protein
LGIATLRWSGGVLLGLLDWVTYSTRPGAYLRAWAARRRGTCR